MFIKKVWGVLLLALGFTLATHNALAKELKVGVIVPMSGPFASYGKQIKHGIDLYMQEYGDVVGDDKITVIFKDDTGISPSVAKRQAQELIIKDKVNILAGFGLTPNAFAVAPLATEAKVPMVVMNAATSTITEKSPNIVRVSMTLAQNTTPIAKWAIDNGIKKAYTLVSDYGPGHDAEKQFQKAFTESGGTVIGDVRTPVNTTDYAPYLQKIKDANPDAVFFFVPNGEPAVALMKGYKERGLDKAGIKAIATGDVTDEDVIDAIGDSALGMITSFHYSPTHDSVENKKFTQAYAATYPDDRPNFMALAGFDGMHLIYEALAETSGSTDPAVFMKAVKGMQWESPRGPVEIDPETRDIIQNVYIREVKRLDGILQNVEFDKIEAVKDPVKADK